MSPLFHRVLASLIIVCGIFLLITCSPEKITVSPDLPVSYTGEFETFRPSLLQHRIDTVTLIIQGEKYDLTHNTNQTNICESAGDIFLSVGVNFVPLIHFGTNCDSLRIPQGIFTSSQHGDSLFLERRGDSAALDIIYQFRLSSN